MKAPHLGNLIDDCLRKALPSDRKLKTGKILIVNQSAAG